MAFTHMIDDWEQEGSQLVFEMNTAVICTPCGAVKCTRLLLL